MVIALLFSLLPLYSLRMEAASIKAEGDYILDAIIIGFYPRENYPGKEKQYDDEVTKVLKDGLMVISKDVYKVYSEDFMKNPNATLNKYKNSKFVRYCEPDYIRKPSFVPVDPNYKTQSGVFITVNAPAAWDVVKGGGPIVAVVDSGVASHPDLPKPVSSFSSVTTLSPSTDKVNHGTAVAGTIGLIGENGIGGVGMDMKANLMVVKVDDANGVLSVANISKGIRWAADNGARIINLSLGGTTTSVTEKDAIDYAFNKGCAIFAATGNESTSSICYPARYPNVFAVGATANGTSKVAFSNYGPGIDVVAISAMHTSNATGGYGSVSGTSFSCPQVSGLASLILAVNPNLTNSELYQLIRDNAKPLGGGYNELTGYGLIDAGKTVITAQKMSSVTIPKEPVKIATPPIITLKGDAMIQMLNDAKFIDPGATAKDEIDGDLTSSIKMTGSVDATKVGVYTLTYSVTNKSGLTGTATRIIVVNQAPIKDVTPPVIELLGDPKMELFQGESYVEPGFTSFDDIDGDLTAFVKIIGEVDTDTVGTYELTYKSVDKSSNEATATREIKVLEVEETIDDVVPLDVPDPVSDSPIEVEVPPTEAPAEVVDETGQEIAEIPPKPEVIVRTAPTIKLVGSKEIILRLYSETPYKEQGATAWDDFDGDLTFSITTIGFVNRDVPGNYYISYTATNSAGLSSTITRGVQIVAPTYKFVQRSPATYSPQQKKGDKLIQQISAPEDGNYKLSIDGFNKFSVKVRITDEKNVAVFDQTLSATFNNDIPLKAGKYQVSMEMMDGNGNNKYNVKIDMPPEVLLIEDTPEVPERGIWSILNFILMIGIVILLTLQLGIMFLVDGWSKNNRFNQKEEMMSLIYMLIGFVLTIVASVLYIKTNQKEFYVLLTNDYTIWMVLLAINQAVVTFIAGFNVVVRRRMIQ